MKLLILLACLALTSCAASRYDCASAKMVGGMGYKSKAR